MLQQAEIDAQLQRILASPAFAGSPRSTQFLLFCVRNGLNGDAMHLKETTIAVEVFNRAPGYDPKSDPIVRVHARRVREKLDLYYRTAGSADPIRIELPKGHYIPSVCRTLPTRKTGFSDFQPALQPTGLADRHRADQPPVQPQARPQVQASGQLPADSRDAHSPHHGNLAAGQSGASGGRHLHPVLWIASCSLLSAVVSFSLARILVRGEVEGA